jgi:oxygen-independent coproporphyrinogen-3 oxidase
MNAAIDLRRIETALGNTPRVAYTAPHVYPHAAPVFQPDPCADRPRPQKDHLRLYVHIPFCNYSCTFCCYAKRVGVRHDQMQRYVHALLRELEWVEPGTPVSQFFVGGGTPTALPPGLLDETLAAINARMPPRGQPVHTVEASPDSISTAHIDVLKRNGVGRISMGIQSLQKDVLETVSRSHGEQTAIEACRLILDHGLILNVDLMYGLPGQRQEDFRKDFETAAALGVHAVTAYSLRLNEYTPVARSIASGEQLHLQRLLDWRTVVRDAAQEFGYTQTRWHTFKRLDSIAARHERLPCFDDDMRGYQFGIGMSARSHLDFTVYRNHKGLNSYMERIESGRSPVEETFPLLPEDRQTQFIARTIGDGKELRFDEYEHSFGRTFLSDYGTVVEDLRAGDLILVDDDAVSLTESGKLLYDLVTLAFYPERARRWLLEKLKDYQ